MSNIMSTSGLDARIAAFSLPQKATAEDKKELRKVKNRVFAKESRDRLRKDSENIRRENVALKQRNVLLVKTLQGILATTQAQEASPMKALVAIRGQLYFSLSNDQCYSMENESSDSSLQPEYVSSSSSSNVVLFNHPQEKESTFSPEKNILMISNHSSDSCSTDAI